MNRKLNRLIFYALAIALHYSGVVRLLLYFQRVILKQKQVCIFAMHRVLTDSECACTNSLEGMVLRESTFTELLEYLSRVFHVLSLEEFRQSIPNHLDGRKPWCVLTFDDGWKDNYTHAYPILRRFQAPATIFLITGMMDTRGGSWVEQLRAAWKSPLHRGRMTEVIHQVLPRRERANEIEFEDVVEFAKHMPAAERNRLLQRLLPPDHHCDQASNPDQMVTWVEAAEMNRNGVDMGAHTVTHPLLTFEDEPTVRNELRDSKKTMEEKLDRGVSAFAYPNGDWNQEVRNEVDRAGFSLAFTTQQRWYRRSDDPLAIPRIMIHEKKVAGIGGRFSPALLSFALVRTS